MKHRREKLDELNCKLHDTFLDIKTQLHQNPQSTELKEKMTEITLKLKDERQRRATEASMRTRLKMTE